MNTSLDGLLDMLDDRLPTATYVNIQTHQRLVLPVNSRYTAQLIARGWYREDDGLDDTGIIDVVSEYGKRVE